MSKKSNKKKTNRRHNATRRVQRARRRRARRRPGRASRPPGPMQAITLTREGYLTTSIIPEDELDDYYTYLEGHHLLPPEFDSWDADHSRELLMALYTLEDPDASADAILRAILILGHIPDPSALAALTRYASSGAPLAGVAKHGADECAMWLESRGPQPRPPRGSASAMLN